MTTEIETSDTIELTPEDIALIESPFQGVSVISTSEAKGTGNTATDETVNDEIVDGKPDGASDAASEATTDASEEDNEPNNEPLFDDADIARAKAVGLDDEDLADFGSPKELHRYLKLAEKLKSAVAGGDSAVSPLGDTEQDRQVQAEASDNSTSELLDLSVYDGTAEAYKDDSFDERSLAIAKAVRREQELRVETQQKLESVQQFVLQLQQERMISQFSDAVDSLENPALGTARDQRGRFVELTQKQLDARTKLFAEVEKVAGEQQKSGKTGLTWEETVAEAGKRIGLGQGKASKADALRQQSASRRPVSSGSASAKAPQQAKSAGPLSVDDLADDPELVAWWNQNAGR